MEQYPSIKYPFFIEYTAYFWNVPLSNKTCQKAPSFCYSMTVEMKYYSFSYQ
jgi:hypothetical protein